MAEVVGNNAREASPSMNLVWTKTAIRDLTEIRDYIARDNPAAAAQMAARLLDASDLLAGHPEMGREGRAPSTRELVMADTDYLIIYRIRKKKLELLRVLHGKRLWPLKKMKAGMRKP